jgi:YHS domain-containing protein
MLPALLLSAALAAGAEPEKPVSAKEAFAPLAPIIGGWKGTGRTEVGTREEREKGFWSEKLSIEWRFKGDDAWLALTVTDGKHFTAGTVRPGTAKDEIRLTLTTADKEELAFTGKLTVGKQKEVILTAEREVGDEIHQFTLTVLHANRFLYQIATRPKAATGFTRQFQVGTTKAGESFAEVAKGPECIVSGGRGTMTVSFKGTTYYVCCSGCRDEFNSDPQKYINLAKEAAAKKDKK